MTSRSRGLLRRRYWLRAGLWTAFIYSTLYVARPVRDFLKTHIPFTAAVNIGVYAILLGVIICLCARRKVKDPNTYGWLLTLCAAYYGAFQLADYVEEKIHFVEYGVLAFLVFRALRVDWPRGAAVWAAWVITALAGWGDEGIQFLLPNRYYDERDILMNACGGALGLAMTMIFSCHPEESRR